MGSEMCIRDSFQGDDPNRGIAVYLLEMPHDLFEVDWFQPVSFIGSLQHQSCPSTRHFQSWHISPAVESHGLVEHQNRSSSDPAVLKVVDGYPDVVDGITLCYEGIEIQNSVAMPFDEPG